MTLPVVMAAEVGLPRLSLTPAETDALRRRLTVLYKGWDDPDGVPVCCLRETPDYLWIPRHYCPQEFWPRVTDWRWTTGKAYDFFRSSDPISALLGGKTPVRLDKERGQTRSVPAMVEYLRNNSGGILVSPTGTGKTTCGLSVAACFGRFIGVPVYAEHMVDNWTKHAKSVLGLRDDEIGLVQGDRCDLSRPVTIMMIQSLLTRTYPQALYDQIGFLALDEITRHSAQQWKSVVALFPARYRLGLSADPVRSDGLEPIISWVSGSVGHRAPRIRTKDATPPTCIMLAWQRGYTPRSYYKWARTDDGRWVPDGFHPVKYDKIIAADTARNRMWAKEIVEAAKAGRRLLVLSRFVRHLQEIKELVDKILDPVPLLLRLALGLLPDGHAQAITTALLVGGAGETGLRRALKAQIIFSTYAMARDAFNDPTRDTGVFVTPPGKVLQPVGRIREKAEGIDRKPLMVVDCHDCDDYSRDKAQARRNDLARLGIQTKEIKRFPGNYE